jgi:hypothetical protein
MFNFDISLVALFLFIFGTTWIGFKKYCHLMLNPTWDASQ